MTPFLSMAYLVVGLTMGAALVVFFYLLWETRRVLLGLSEAVIQFAATTKEGPALMEEAVTSLREIRTTVEGQARQRKYVRPGRRNDPSGLEEEPPERIYRNPLDEVAREGAEVGTVS